MESINASLKEARCLPVAELLIKIEEKVAKDRLKSLRKEKQIQHGGLTGYAEKLMKAARADGIGFTVMEMSEGEWLVKAPRPFQVSVGDGARCSCGASPLFGLPCSHILRVLTDKGLNPYLFCCPSWAGNLIRAAYKPFTTSFPMSIRENLVMNTLLPLKAVRRRGRPRKNRIESQRATQELDAAPPRVYRCAACKQVGHKRRSCRVASAQPATANASVSSMHE